MTEARLAQILIEGPVLERVQGLGNSMVAAPSRAGAGTGGSHRGGTGGEAVDLNRAGSNLNKKVSVYLNRLLLRIFSVPSLMTYLADVMPVKNPDGEEGAVNIQLDFLRLPDEIVPQVERLIAAPGKLKWFKYVKDGSARTGVEVPVEPDDLEGKDYDYAY